jgi:hypothetical protein
MGKRAYYLHVKGNEIAKRLGYTEHEGIEALYFYLVEKHHWLPAQVRSLSWDDLWFFDRRRCSSNARKEAIFAARLMIRH